MCAIIPINLKKTQKGAVSWIRHVERLGGERMLVKINVVSLDIVGMV